jgi:hypothetical protein
MRSADAPAMSAAAMTAKPSWNMQNTDSGTVGALGWPRYTSTLIKKNRE